MATLAAMLNLKAGSGNVILVGTPELTNILDSDGKPYFVVQLFEERTVRCSVDPDILPHPVTEVYVREAALGLEGWEFVDATKPELGYFMPNWVVDFSKGQKVAILQETSIRTWTKDSRRTRLNEDRASINNSIKTKLDALKAGQQQ